MMPTSADALHNCALPIDLYGLCYIASHASICLFDLCKEQLWAYHTVYIMDLLYSGKRLIFDRV